MGYHDAEFYLQLDADILGTSGKEYVRSVKAVALMTRIEGPEVTST